MKITKMIALLLVFVLVLAGCGKGISNELLMFPDAPEQSDINALPDKYNVKDLVTSYWSQGFRFGDKSTAITYYISIPQIYPYSQDAVACQQEIYDAFKTELYDDLTLFKTQYKENIKQKKVPKYAFTEQAKDRTYTYTAGIYENILSVVLRFEIPDTRNSNYYVYYLDLTTGKQLTTQQIQEKFDEEITRLINNQEASFQKVYAKNPNEPARHVKDGRVFFTENGKITYILRIYTEGSPEIVEHLVRSI